MTERKTGTVLNMKAKNWSLLRNIIMGEKSRNGSILLIFSEKINFPI